MSKSQYEVICGLSAMAFGCWVVRASFRSRVPSLIQLWWIKRDAPYRPTVERAVACVVGLGFAFVGFAMVIQGAGHLLRSPS